MPHVDVMVEVQRVNDSSDGTTVEMEGGEEAVVEYMGDTVPADFDMDVQITVTLTGKPDDLRFRLFERNKEYRVSLYLPQGWRKAPRE